MRRHSIVRLFLFCIAVPLSQSLVDNAYAIAEPSSCFLKQDDARNVRSSTTPQPLTSAGVTIFTPCQGTVTSEGVWMWFTTDDGRTQRRLVKSSQTLQDVLGATATKSLSDPGTYWHRLLNALADQRQPRPGVSRFDARYGIEIEGSILTSKDFAIPLDAFRWDPQAVVTLIDPAGKSTPLTPVGGRVVIPATRMQPGAYSLTQGRLRAGIEVPPAAEIDEMRSALETIDREETEPRIRQLRRAILFSEGNYVLNLVSESVDH